MAVNIVTGRDITLEIDGVQYSDQLTSATLASNRTDEQYITFTDSAPKAGPVTFTLTVRGFQDWTSAAPPAVDGWSRAMYAAAVAGSNVAFELVVDTGTWTGNILPVFPTAGGDANAALETEMVFQVVGTPSFT